MSDKLGPMSFRIGEEHVFLGKEIQEPRDFSETTAAEIDREVQRLLREADERAKFLLETNRERLDNLVTALLEKEELFRDEIYKILGGKRPSRHAEELRRDGILAPTNDRPIPAPEPTPAVEENHSPK
jgi:cell division protease FtsH